MTKLYAKHLEVLDVDPEQAERFLKDYHLQGTCGDQHVYKGLCQNGMLVALMTFGYPRYNANAQWELLRLCYKRDFTIVGGAGKLFSAFIKDKQPDCIISYCNLDYFTGDVYLSLGFSAIGSPRESFKWVKGDKWYSDSELRKHGADQLIRTAQGKGSNNEEVMLSEGYERVHYQTVQTYVWSSKITGIIYKITNNLNGKTYVGMSKTADDRRWREHLSDSKYPVDKAIKKYGKENFTYEVIDTAQDCYTLAQKARKWIAELRPEYNIRWGGYLLYRTHRSEESRAKMREAAKHRPKISEETRRKMSLAQKARTNRALTEQAKVNIGKARKGMKWFNNGTINKLAFECPEGFVAGQIRKSCTVSKGDNSYATN